MEGRRAHFAANMEGMSMMVVDGNHPEDGGFWNPHYTLSSTPEPRSANTNHMHMAKPTFFHYTRIVCLLEGGGLKGNGVCCGKEPWEY